GRRPVSFGAGGGQPQSSQMPVAGSTMKHVGHTAGAFSGSATRAVVVRRGARAGEVDRAAVRRAGAGAAGAAPGTSNPRLRSRSATLTGLLRNSSAVATRPVAYRCATPRIAWASYARSSWRSGVPGLGANP